MMDKKEAMARLDAIESEAKKLREIIEAPEKWVPKKPTLCYRWDGDKRPDECRVAIIEEFDGYHYGDSRNGGWDHAVPLTRAEALALVDEPSRYPWDKAPEWAMWAATDWDGSASWYEDKPEADDGDDYWTCGMGEGRPWEECHRFRGKGNVSCAGWRETLEPRP